ncbi:MAG: ABC transporter permease [Candidatus Aminicenantes bacterium]|nr:MAG: ABC transporter permease [Candidatus Aminicenantes bacterium]
MLKNYLKIVLRNMKSNKIYSFINIAGLAIGIACFLAIFLYVRFEMSYDNYHHDADRIYRVSTIVSSLNMPGNRNRFAPISAPATPVIKENFPQVEKAARFKFGRRVLVQYKDKMFYESNCLYADQELFDIFSIPVIKGDVDNLIIRPGTIVLTDGMAKKYFGNEDPVGKTIQVDDAHFEITGVVKDPRRNTHVKYHFIASLDFMNLSRWQRESWNLTNYYTYLKVNQDIDVKSFENSINTFLKSNPGQLRDDWTYFLQPLRSIHLHSDLLYEVEPPGNPTYLSIFCVIGVFILLIAAVNFVNLTTARSTSRAKEVGLRKVIGAQRGQLIRQFLGESLLLSVFAIAIAVFMVFLLLPFLSDLTGIEFQKNDLFNPGIMTGLLVLACLIGLGAGFYPALLLSGFRPILTLKGIFRSGSGRVALRKSLVVFQFAIAVMMIISTLIVYFQLDYMKNANLGFDKEQKLIVQAKLSKNNYESIKNEFLRHHAIKGATASSSVPGRGDQTWGISLKGKDFSGLVFNHSTVDYDFLSEYKLGLIAGEAFYKEKSGGAAEVCVINEAGAKALGFDLPENALGKEIVGGGRGLSIIGIVKDFHYRGLQQKIDPLMLVLPNDRYNDLFVLTLTLETKNLPETLKFVENKWKELKLGAIFIYRFLDEDFDRLYRTEERVGKIFSTFTALGLFIAFLGLFGLALFSAEQRTKEIGIRKVLGATISSIIILLTKEFIGLVALGMLTAFPIAYYAMHRWLQSFAYRTSISFWTFVFSATLALVIALITVSFQSIKAATANPVDSLHYE